MTEAKREIWVLKDSHQIIRNIHPKEWCSGRCVVHAPSDHNMRSFPLAWAAQSRTFYRTCPHGVNHQDPDERDYWMNLAEKQKTMKMALEKLSEYDCPLHLGCDCCSTV